MNSFPKLTEEDFSEQMQELAEKIQQFNEVTQIIMNPHQTEEEKKQAEKTFRSLFFWLSDRGILLIYNREKGIWEIPEQVNRWQQYREQTKLS